MRKGLVAAICLVAAACGRRGEAPPDPATTASADADASATSPRSCMLVELTPLKIARIDEAQRRLFLVAPDAADATIAARIHDLDACFELTEWAGRWSLSVFTDAALARYKDDPKVAAAVSDGRWARAYVAEYDAAGKKMTRHPAGAP